MTATPSYRRFTPDELAAAEAATSVEALARARYGDPDRIKTTARTAVWPHTDHGTLLVGRPGSGALADAFRFTDGLKGKGPIQWRERVEGLAFPKAVRSLLAGAGVPPAPQAVTPPASAPLRPYRRPPAAPAAWPAVRAYLVARGLSRELVEGLHRRGLVYATEPAPGAPYAVFPIRAPDGREVGAFERFAGAPEAEAAQAAYGLKRVRAGSDPAAGAWTVGRGPVLVLTEAPLDAAAVLDAVWQAGAGHAITVRAVGGSAFREAVHLLPLAPDRPWHAVVAAFDADAAGEAFADRLARWAANAGLPYTRLVPPVDKDWSAAWAEDRTLARRAVTLGLDRLEPGTGIAMGPPETDHTR